MKPTAMCGHHGQQAGAWCHVGVTPFVGQPDGASLLPLLGSLAGTAAAAPSNPFAAATPVWNMAPAQAPGAAPSAFATPNPFEAVAPTGGVFGGLDGMGGLGAGMFAGSPNGFALAGSAPLVQQKGVGYVGWGGAAMPAPGGGLMAAAPQVAAQWPTAMGKVAGPMATDWSQVGSPVAANPFLSGPLPRTNSSNPFL